MKLIETDWNWLKLPVQNARPNPWSAWGSPSPRHQLCWRHTGSERPSFDGHTLQHRHFLWPSLCSKKTNWSSFPVFACEFTLVLIDCYAALALPSVKTCKQEQRSECWSYPEPLAWSQFNLSLRIRRVVEHSGTIWRTELLPIHFLTSKSSRMISLKIKPAKSGKQEQNDDIPSIFATSNLAV